MKAKTQLLCILSTSLLSLVASAAQASVYRSASGETQLLLQDGKWVGQYQTKIDGRLWQGDFRSDRTLGQAGNRSLYGTFKDASGSSSCTGDFFAYQAWSGDRYTLTTAWTPKGGKNCPAIGQRVELDLAEPFPVPNAQGDFLPSNSDTVWYGIGAGQNDFHTWDRWQIVESGSLNCREKPAGRVVRAYRQGQVIEASYDARGVATAIMGTQDTYPSGEVKGDAWMKTKDKCYVRANQRHIKPIGQAIR